jgi:hypothetical protein
VRFAQPAPPADTPGVFTMAIPAFTIVIQVFTMAIRAFTIAIRVFTMRRSWRSRCADLGVHDPAKSAAGLGLDEKHKKTRVHATVDGGTNLLALASEGQLSGVNLAVQLAMALAFRWCRWPAVLLDDPAQYSDAVHSTNLVETLRVLALHHGFQVFLATHERDFALYVERKFRNDGLPATRVMFRQPSDPGLGVVPRLASRLG